MMARRVGRQSHDERTQYIVRSASTEPKSGDHLGLSLSEAKLMYRNPYSTTRSRVAGTIRPCSFWWMLRPIPGIDRLAAAPGHQTVS
jgi:hypothetical protein